MRFRAYPDLLTEREKKMKRILCMTLLLAVLAAVPSFACYNRCENGECVTKGFVTWQDCHMSGPVCIDDPVWGECSAPVAKDADTPVTLAEILSVPETTEGGGATCR
jgi:hypothetical protein